MSLALVYLARGVGGGLSSVKAFFNAYDIHPAGCPHELIVIIKGWDGIEGLVEAKKTKRDPRVGQQQAKLYADCLEKQFVRLEIGGVRWLCRARHEHQAQCARHRGRDFVLYREHIRELAIVPIRPRHLLVGRRHQLRGDAQL